MVQFSAKFSESLKIVNSDLRKKGKRDPIKNEPTLNFGKALKEVRTLEPDFMRKSARYSTQKLTPQQKGAITKKLSALEETMRYASGRDIFVPNKKKGETKKAYKERLDTLKKINGQADLAGIGLFMEPLNKDNAKTTYRIDKDGKVISKTKSEFRSQSTVYIPASQVPPDYESAKKDLIEALKFGEKGEEPTNVTVNLNGRRSYVSESYENFYKFKSVEQKKPKKKKLSMADIEKYKKKKIIRYMDEKKVDEFIEKIMNDLMDYGANKARAYKAEAVNLAFLYRGIILEWVTVR